MTIRPELLNELLADCKTPGDVDTLYSQLLQKMINRSLEVRETRGTLLANLLKYARQNPHTQGGFPVTLAIL